MHGLVDKSPATIHFQGAAPLRAAVVLGRPIPLYFRIDEQWVANCAVLDPLLKLSNVWFEAILEHHSQFDASLLRRLNEFIGPFY